MEPREEGFFPPRDLNLRADIRKKWRVLAIGRRPEVVLS
jgi:hypothetical protein